MLLLRNLRYHHPALLRQASARTRTQAPRLAAHIQPFAPVYCHARHLSSRRKSTSSDSTEPTQARASGETSAGGGAVGESGAGSSAATAASLVDVVDAKLDAESRSSGASLFTFPDPAPLFPEGLCGALEADLEIFRGGFMCPDLLPEFAAQLSRIEAGGGVEEESGWGEACTVLQGEGGVGKSFFLNCAVAYARAKGWVVLLAPHPIDWVTESKAQEMGTGVGHGVVPSPVTKELFSNPKGARKMLEQFKQLYCEKLQGIPQRREYSHGLYTRDGDMSLVNIIDRGILTLPAAGNAVYDLRMELGLLEEYPVLVVADQMNTLYWPSCFYSLGQVVDSSQMLLPRTFRCLSPDGDFNEEYKIKRGYQLYASTAKYPLPKSAKEFQMQSPFTPTGNLKRAAPEGSPYKGLQLKPYNKEELQLILAHYSRCLKKEATLSPLVRHELNNLPQHVRDAVISSPIFEL